jgi:phosphohistidine swiveling domain-containing protein
MQKIVFTKEYERDITLVPEEYWSRGFHEYAVPKLGLNNPPKEFIVFFATDENLQIWENAAAMQWLLDGILVFNRQGTEWIKAVLAEYQPRLERIQAYWNAGPMEDNQALIEYTCLFRETIAIFSLWYYSGVDDRTPADVREIVLKVRETDEFFARNDVYIKDCIERLGGDRRYANLVFCDEFPKLPPAEELVRRATGVVSIDGRERSLASLKEFAGLHPEYEFQGLFDSVEQLQEVKGQVAQKGIVTGRVRIVKNKFQMEAVEEGDILISPMTTPDFISAMHRAGAFVTDEGGVMCHAAIVARELKKPCIIGTKNATQVFHDGDVVEVNADTGVVRKK